MPTPTDPSSTDIGNNVREILSTEELQSEPWPPDADTDRVQQRMDFGDEEPDPEEDTQVETALGWTRGDRFFLTFGCAVIFVLLLLRWHQLTGGNIQSVEFTSDDAYEFRVDINSATWVEWSQIDGIGPKTARAIVADREANGPFKSIDEIQRVKGIGPATVRRIRPFVINPADKSDR